MFDEDELPKPKKDAFVPLNTERFSIDELKEYITDLEQEITRVKNDIDNKNNQMGAASALFKE